MKIQDKLRASSVKRWHIVDTARDQTLAEHQWNVTMISLELCDVLEFKSWRPLVTILALEHDIEEVCLGDIPSPAKPDKIWEKKWSPEKIVRVADIIEALWFIRQFGLGHTGRMAEEYMMGQFHTMLDSQSDWAGVRIQRVLNESIYGEFYEERRKSVLAGNPDGPEVDGSREPGGEPRNLDRDSRRLYHIDGRDSSLDRA
jgi:hypothetical protein